MASKKVGGICWIYPPARKQSSPPGWHETFLGLRIFKQNHYLPRLHPGLAGYIQGVLKASLVQNPPGHAASALVTGEAEHFWLGGGGPWPADCAKSWHAAMPSFQWFSVMEKNSETTLKIYSSRESEFSTERTPCDISIWQHCSDILQAVLGARKIAAEKPVTGRPSLSTFDRKKHDGFAKSLCCWVIDKFGSPCHHPSLKGSFWHNNSLILQPLLPGSWKKRPLVQGQQLCLDSHLRTGTSYYMLKCMPHTNVCIYIDTWGCTYVYIYIYYIFRCRQTCTYITSILRPNLWSPNCSPRVTHPTKTPRRWKRMWLHDVWSSSDLFAYVFFWGVQSVWCLYRMVGQKWGFGVGSFFFV